MSTVTPIAPLSERSGSTPRPARRGARWPLMIVGLLGLNIVITAALILYANADSSYAVEPEFYQKALAWDQTQAQMGANERLAWVVAADAAPRQDAAGLRSLRVLLRDRNARPIAGASVRAEMFHQARSSQRVRAELKDAGDGSYLASLPLSRPGKWEVRITAGRAGDTFTHTLTLDVASASSASDGVSD